MTSNHPQEYTDFLRAWLAFAENPLAPEDFFCRRHGLCTSLFRFMWSHPQRYSSSSVEGYLSNRLGGSFAPFNDGVTTPLYENEADKTLNPKRLAFVRRELGIHRENVGND